MSTYPGGKNGMGVYQTIINQMPPHDLYIEPFLGSGAVLRMKRAAPSTIAIDRDEVAVAAVSAKIGDSAGCTFICGDGIRWLQQHRSWTGRELIYADPPYLFSARKDPQRVYYSYDMGDDRSHIELLATLKTLPALIMISGYESSLYREMLEGWRVLSFQTMTRGGTLATEWLWMNFAQPIQLHDYRYIGKTFREREKLNRRVRRIVSKYKRMPAIERLAIAAALAHPGDPISEALHATSGD